MVSVPKLLQEGKPVSRQDAGPRFEVAALHESRGRLARGLQTPCFVVSNSIRAFPILEGIPTGDPVSQAAQDGYAEVKSGHKDLDQGARIGAIEALAKEAA